jgi:hypothetical protein
MLFLLSCTSHFLCFSSFIIGFHVSIRFPLGHWKFFSLCFLDIRAQFLQICDRYAPSQIPYFLLHQTSLMPQKWPQKSPWFFTPEGEGWRGRRIKSANNILLILHSCDRASWRDRASWHVTVHRDMWPCIVTNFLAIKPTRCTNFSNLFWK